MKAYAVADFSEDVEQTRFLERIDLLARLGVEVVQLRAKELDDRDLLDLAGRCRDRIGPGTRYLVNGRADVAMAVRADGVHLPADGVPVAVARHVAPDLIVGRSCHSVEEVLHSVEEGADLVLMGPVFDVRSSRKRGAISDAELRASASLTANVYAIGGLKREHLQAIADTGVAGVAGITMFMQDEPLGEILAEIHEAPS